jgi:hypothetical protein
MAIAEEHEDAIVCGWFGINDIVEYAEVPVVPPYTKEIRTGIIFRIKSH